MPGNGNPHRIEADGRHAPKVPFGNEGLVNAGESLVVLNGAQILLQLGIRAGAGGGEQGRRDPGLGDKPSRKIDSSNSIVHAMPFTCECGA